MTTPTSPSNGTLVLARPFVRGATQTVIGAHIGIALAILDLVIDGLGAYVDIDPAPFGTVDPGDTCKLWLDGDPAPLDTKTITNPNVRLEMRIGQGRLNSAKVNQLFYTIERGSQNVGTSPWLDTLYNKIRPGLKDTKPEIDGHSELEMILSDEIKNGVGPGFISGQVCFSYPYCRAYDTITLKCNGETVTFTVGQNEAPQPPDPGSAIPTTVCFIVDRAFLDLAARPNGMLDFSYTVTDQLLNTPDPDAVWSATQTVDEDLKGKRFPAVIFREQANDPGDVSGIIDLAKLGSNQLQVIFLTAHPAMEAGDHVKMMYTARVAGNSGVEVTLTDTIKANEFGQKEVLIQYVNNADVPAGATVETTCEVSRNGTPIGRAVTARAVVTGQGLPARPEPKLQQSDAAGFNPMAPANQKSGNIHIDIPGAAVGDKVQAFVTNGAPGPGTPTFAVKPLNQNNRVNYLVDSKFICENMGRSLDIHYDLIIAGQAHGSKVLTVLIQKIKDFDPALPVGTIDGNTGTTLDVSQLTAASEIRWPAWIHQVVGQIAWVWLEGVDSSGNTVVHHVLQGVALGAGPGLVQPVPLTWLQALNHDSALKMHFSLNYDGVANEAVAVKFPVRNYTVEAASELLPPRLDHVRDENDQEVPERSTTISSTLTIAGVAPDGKTVELFEKSELGERSLGEKNADSFGYWEQRVTPSAGEKSFFARARYTSNPPDSNLRNVMVYKYFEKLELEPNQKFCLEQPQLLASGLTVHVTAFHSSIWKYPTVIGDSYIQFNTGSTTQLIFNGKVRFVEFICRRPVNTSVTSASITPMSGSTSVGAAIVLPPTNELVTHKFSSPSDFDRLEIKVAGTNSGLLIERIYWH